MPHTTAVELACFAGIRRWACEVVPVRSASISGLSPPLRFGPALPAPRCFPPLSAAFRLFAGFPVVGPLVFRWRAASMTASVGPVADPNDLTPGAAGMDDSLCQSFFRQPACPAQRQYEALRAVFLEGDSQKDAAARFGYSPAAFRQLVHPFRRGVAAGAAPPFSPPSAEADRPARPGPAAPGPTRPTSPTSASWTWSRPSASTTSPAPPATPPPPASRPTRPS